ncbi:MAG: cobalamin biosynthesis protein, partial [Clostridia bacterium]|nr:cobalamin biosynthesis protein [Clostridia bacterium]
RLIRRQRQIFIRDSSLQASEAAARHVGTRGVAEPAALLSAGADTLLVPKRKTARATVAAARGRCAAATGRGEALA